MAAPTAGLMAAIALAGCSTSPDVSGQTGSPNNDGPPTYDTPVLPDPGDSSHGGGQTGGENLGFSPGDVLPHRSRDKRAVHVDDVLLLGGDSLVLLDADDPGRIIGRWGEEHSSVQLVSAESLAAVTIVTRRPREYTAATVPEHALSDYAVQLVVLDARDSDSPSEVASVELPNDVATVVARGDGYTALGGGTPAEPPACAGSRNELGFSRTYAAELWAQQIARSDSALELGERRTFTAGYWELSSDEQTAFFVAASEQGEEPTLLGVVEAVVLASLETRYAIELPPEELVSTWHALAVDARRGLLLATGVRSVMAFDTGSGARLATLATASQPSSVQFVSDDLATVTGGGGLIRIDRAATPAALALIPTSGGARVPGSLHPFGDGFLEISATNENASYLVATLFGGDLGAGQLQARSQLTTDFPFRLELDEAVPIGRDRSLDTDAGVLALALDRYDEAQGEDHYQVMVVRERDGQLVSSEWTSVQGKYGTPIADGDRVLYTSGAALEAFDVEAAGGDALSLAPGEVTPLGLQDLWFELEHAGYWLAKHRNSYGATRVSVRPAHAAAPIYVEVPYRVDAIVPLDEQHVAVLGLATPAECEIAATKTGEAFPECAPGGSGTPEYNGISVLALGEEPRLVGSVALSTFLGDRLPDGAERRIQWAGHLRLSASRLVMLAAVHEDCRTLAACEALGVVPRVYEEGSMGGGSGAPSTPPGCSGEACPEPDPEPQWPIVDGSRSAEWLVPIDLSDLESPRVGAPTTGGLRDGLPGEFHRYGVEPWLLRGAGPDLFAYPSVENLYDEHGEHRVNEHGHPVQRNYLQLFEATPDSLTFRSPLNVPGRAVLLGPSSWALDDQAEHTLLTLSGGYAEAASDFQPVEELLRLSVRDGGAYVTERLQLPALAHVAVGRGTRLALVSMPGDYCAEDATLEVRLIEASARELSLSEPLALDGRWGWHVADWAPQPADEDLLHLFGGPANNGRAVVDISGEMPRLVAYESFEW